MTAWVKEAEASTKKCLIFKAVNSRTAKKLRALNEDFVWKLSIHSTEDKQADLDEFWRFIVR
jgi:hypothetical protein